MKKLLFFSIFILIASGSVFAGKPLIKKNNASLRQVILIKFKDKTTPAQIHSLDSLTQVLNNKVKTLRNAEWGKRIDFTEVSTEYDYCLMFEFKTENDFEIFQENPLRLKFFGKLIPMSDKMLKFIYQVNK